MFTNILGPSTFGSVGTLHHPLKQIREELIAIYLHNIDPVFKIIHAPTLRAQAHKLDSKVASGAQPPTDDAMLFAVYAAAIMSMEDMQCKRLLGQSRLHMIRQFSHAAQTCLFSADMLNPRNLTTLQAFILYLVSQPQSRADTC